MDITQNNKTWKKQQQNTFLKNKQKKQKYKYVNKICQINKQRQNQINL